jgi:hypothetical protein
MCSIATKSYFAFTFPYSYEYCINYINQEQVKHSSIDSSVLFSSMHLAYSLQGRSVPLITITEKLGNMHKRKQVFLSARVHPGETPSSFVMEGLLQFLTSDDARAKILRQEFIFYAVPMINVDGVYNGYYRMDTRGLNMNRLYNGSDESEIISSMMKFISTLDNLFFYMDMHAHASKQGCFVYGNCLDDYSAQIMNVMWSKIFSMNCHFVDFGGGNFSESRMSSNDLLGKSRDGTGRVGVYNMKSLIHCYTLECNYNSGKTANHLPLLSNQLPNAKAENRREAQVEKRNPRYTPETFRDVGKAIAISILDIVNKNPYSRIYNSSYKNRERLEQFIGKLLHSKKKFWNYHNINNTGVDLESENIDPYQIPNRVINRNNSSRNRKLETIKPKSPGAMLKTKSSSNIRSFVINSRKEQQSPLRKAVSTSVDLLRKYRKPI